jgi:putative nucleotidyltransferase with HDIG domain
VKRILFVDDEPNVLDGLKRMLRPQRNVWEMAFAADGPAALELLAAAPYDAIISDMRMPGMDGAALLSVVGERYPAVIRIILSGYTELEASVRAVPVAHQFLLKPCDPTALRSAIERQMKMVDRFHSPPVAQLVGSVRVVPTAPQTVVHLRESVAMPHPSLDRVTDIVARDVGMAARVLHLANSAFFGQAREVADIRTGISCLGTRTLEQLIEAGQVFLSFEPTPPSTFSIDRFERHSRLTAAIAQQLPAGDFGPETMFAAGLLHDIGKLVLADHDPDRFANVQIVARTECRRSDDVEAESFGLSHAEIGAYLLCLWGLPDAVVEAVANHHHPERAPDDVRPISAAIYLANRLSKQCRGADPGASGERPEASEELDQTILEVLGGAHLMPGWHAMAVEVAGRD